MITCRCSLLLYLLLVCLPTSVRSQGTAVIVGISDYREDQITDLRYAHRDAEAFADFLEDKGVEVRLLTDGAATRAAIASALAWQLAETPPGERAILYFAGHGDVESTTGGTDGFLLAHDTPPNNYRLTAISIDDLNDHLASLTGAGSTALVLLDACHAGSLAGDAIGGRELTAGQLRVQRRDEVRVFSCLPDETALEGPQWGGGRGVFSYYLVEGLGGLADGDRNRVVDLFELETFVREQVRKATDRRQLPNVSGDQRAEVTFRVGADTSGQRRETAARDLREEFERGMVALAPATVQRDYLRFGRALKRGQLVQPAETSALAYYRKLRAAPELLPLTGVFTERLTTQLMDSVQQALVAYLAADADEIRRRDSSATDYGRYVEYLGTTADLLGPVDPRTTGITARKHYFQAVDLRLREQLSGSRSDSVYRVALAEAERARELEGSAAYIHNEIGILNGLLKQYGAADSAYRRAIELAPTWALPYNGLAIVTLYASKTPDYTEVRRLYDRALALRPDYASSHYNIGNLMLRTKAPDSAIVYYQQALSIDPQHRSTRFNLANTLLKQQKRLPESISLLEGLVAEFPERTAYARTLAYAREADGDEDGMQRELRDHLRRHPSDRRAWNHLLNVPDDRSTATRTTHADFAADQRAFPAQPYPYVGMAIRDTASQDWWEALGAVQLPTDERYALTVEVAQELFNRYRDGDAVQAFRAAIALSPDQPLAHYRLTHLYLELQDDDAAAAAAGALLNVLPDSEERTAYCAHFSEDGEFYELVSRQSQLSTIITSTCNTP